MLMLVDIDNELDKNIIWYLKGMNFPNGTT